jgi:hypothetical protein
MPDNSSVSKTRKGVVQPVILSFFHGYWNSVKISFQSSNFFPSNKGLRCAGKDSWSLCPLSPCHVLFWGISCSYACQICSVYLWRDCCNPSSANRTVFQLLFRCKTRESIWQLGDSHWPQVAAWFLSTWIRLTWLLNTILVSMSYKLETTFSLAYKSQYTMQDQTKHSFLPTQMQYKSISMFLNYVCIYISIANANNKTQETPNCAKTWINFPACPRRWAIER